MTGAAPRRRVAVVAACSFPSPRGSQVLVRAVAEQLAAAGHAVHLVTYGSTEVYQPPPGVHWHRTPWAGGAPSRPGLRWSKLLQDVALLALLWRVVRRERVEVIHAHNYEAPLLAYLVRRTSGVPVVYHAHNALADELASYARAGHMRRWAQRLGAWLDRQIPRRADFSIALTPELGDFLRRCGVPQDRTVVLPPAGLPEVETPPARADPATFDIVYAGNLDPYQDLDVLADAFARLCDEEPAARLAIVTHEADWRSRLDPRFATWAAAGVASVLVVADYAAVVERMAAADVLVCSRSSWSGYPIKLLNYAGVGRPIVVARGSAKGLCDRETALIVPDRDPVALAAALAELRQHPELAQALGRAAQRWASEQLPSGEEIASKFDMVYGKIASEVAVHSVGARVCGRGRENV